LKKAHEQNVRHAEVFFDPQAHTERGVPMQAIIEGLHHAFLEGEREFGISSALILCFLRHLSAAAAMQTLEAALPYREYFSGVGLDSSERVIRRKNSQRSLPGPARKACLSLLTPARKVRRTMYGRPWMRFRPPD